MPLPNTPAWSRKPIGGAGATDPMPSASGVLKAPRRKILGDIEAKIRDPELLDALRQHKLILDELRGPGTPERFELCIFSLCEVSRDALIRLTPFPDAETEVIALALDLCQQALHAAAGFRASETVARYLSNIQNRVEEYSRYLASVRPVAKSGA